LLVAVTPRRLVQARDHRDVCGRRLLVISNLLAAPNNSLNAAAPVADLPQLQRVLFGSAVMGYGDLFIAGCSAHCSRLSRGRSGGRRWWRATLALLSDLLFFACTSCRHGADRADVDRDRGGRTPLMPSRERTGERRPAIERAGRAVVRDRG